MALSSLSKLALDSLQSGERRVYYGVAHVIANGGANWCRDEDTEQLHARLMELHKWLGESDSPFLQAAQKMKDRSYEPQNLTDVLITVLNRHWYAGAYGVADLIIRSLAKSVLAHENTNKLRRILKSGSKSALAQGDEKLANHLDGARKRLRVKSIAE